MTCARRGSARSPNSCRRRRRRAPRPTPRSMLAGSADARRGRRPPPRRRRHGRSRRASPFRQPSPGRRCLRSSAHRAGASERRQSHFAFCGLSLNCGRNVLQPSKAKTRFRNYGGLPTYPDNETPQKKGRPPPGGEEAEVVVYQPRGVGLMHTRHKPSNPHYTHGKPKRRKCCLPPKAPDSLEEVQSPAPVVNCHFGHARSADWSRHRPYAGRCDRNRSGGRGGVDPANDANNRSARSHGGVLRSRQDRHRQVQHAGFQQTLLRPRANQQTHRLEVDATPSSCS